MGDIWAKRQHNAARPICSLPTELIAHILLCYRDQSLDFEDEDQELQELVDEEMMYLKAQDWFAWLPAIHTCHRLREVALFSPRLWDHIRPWKDGILATFLARSQSVPIDVVFFGGASEHSVRTVLQQLPRLRSLCIDVHRSEYDLVDNEPWAGLPAPHLERVHINDVAGFYEPEILHLLLHSHIPSLWYLHILHPEWHWMDDTLPSTLTRFSVSTQVAWISTRERATKALSQLRALPLLEHLYIDEFLEDDERDSPREVFDALADIPIVALPNLESFEFRGRPLACLRLLDRICIPLDCELDIRLRPKPDAVEDLEEIRTLLNRVILISDTQSVPFTTLDLHIREGLPTYVFKQIRAADPSPDYCPDVTIQFQGEDPEQDILQPAWCHYLREIMSGLDMSSLRTLKLHYPCQPATLMVNFCRVLRQMPNIEWIFAQSRPLHELTRLIPIIDNENDPQVVLPRLRALSLFDFDFAAVGLADDDENDDREHADRGHADRENHGDDVAEFISWLRERRERDVGIRILILTDCENVSAESVQRMRTEVEEVHVHKTEPESEDEDETWLSSQGMKWSYF